MLWRKGHYGGRSETAARNDADYTLVAHGNIGRVHRSGVRANDFGGGVQRARGRMS